jgi:hypothetical protein
MGGSTVVNQIEAMKQALEALEKYPEDPSPFTYRNVRYQSQKAITALRTAIAEAESRANEQAAVPEAHKKQKPYAWEFAGALFHNKDEVFEWAKDTEISSTPPLALYTHPAPAAQRQWVGLTDEEIKNGCDLHGFSGSAVSAFASGAEFALIRLREKNGGAA